MKIPEGQGQLTFVALFGDKSQTYPELEDLIIELQHAIVTILGPDVFKPYPIDLVHGTIIGLEGFRNGEYVWNVNCYDMIKMQSPMDIRGLFDFLLAENPLIPVTIKVGGFKKDETYPFTSRGESPYVRSFSIRGKIAVAMGWPVRGGLYTPAIDVLRRSFNRFNVLHKYHDAASSYDNDFFFVLGNVPKGLSQDVVDLCQNQIRDILSGCDIPSIQISKDQLSVVAYKDTRFKEAEAGSLREAKDKIEELLRFYPERSC